MTRLTTNVMGFAAAVLVLSACVAPQNTDSQGQRSSETGCLTANDSSACKFDHLRAGGENIVLPQGAGDGNGSRRR